MSNAKKLRILVIDDDPSITNLLKVVLNKAGHHVLSFPDPVACPLFQKAACECPQQFPCADIIISDIAMPNMTGIEFFRLQREKGCKALDANKALMSAAIDPRQKEVVKELGCHFIRKPFKIAGIVEWVEECAQRIPSDRMLAKLG